MSAIVVNYHAGSVLPACVASLWAEGVEQVVVVDNGDSEGRPDQACAEALRRAGLAVTWVPAGRNLGYGRAVNLGARSCPTGDLLVCNPDIVLRPGALEPLRAALADRERVGAVGPRLLNRDESVYPSARTFPSIVDAVGHGALGVVWSGNRWTRRYRLLDWDHAERRVVDWVSGACMLIRRRAWDDVSGFDAGYFMYLEDVDLCWRLGRARWQVLYEPAAEVLHAQGVSAETHPYRMIVAHHCSLCRFAWRSTTGWRRALLLPVLAGVAVRTAAACALRWSDGRRKGGSRRVEAVE